MASEDDATAAQESGQCRVCGTETRQKAGGDFLCSLTCRPPPDEVYECPYPECDWVAERRGDLPLSYAKFRADIRSHRRDHQP